ncbi:HotDog domain-containing protein [Aspergillus spinulosporus]
MHPSAQVTHLVTTSLISPTKLPIDPIYFLKHSFTDALSQSPKSVEIIATAYLSTHLTGHAGYVHGGLIGILFDDVFARLAAEIFPSGVGMTANLTLDFRAPAVPGRVYVWRAGIEKVEKERKVWVYGRMRCLNENGVEEMRGRGVEDSIPRELDEGSGLSMEEREGVLVAEARGLFVEPRGVKKMVPLYPK